MRAVVTREPQAGCSGSARTRIGAVEASEGRGGERVGPAGRRFEAQQRRPGSAPDCRSTNRRPRTHRSPGSAANVSTMAGASTDGAQSFERPRLRVQRDERAASGRRAGSAEERAAHEQPAVVQREGANGRGRIGATGAT